MQLKINSALPSPHTLDPDSFYRELTTRNGHFVAPEVQNRIRGLKVFIAGCGSGGGACTLPLARLGVEHFRLADNGSYELSNLNRQHCLLQGVGQNKAEFHESQIRGLNPHADVKSFPEGITPTNVKALVQWADLVLDCVDVTTPEGIRMKIALHECAKLEKKPTFSPLDMGYCQAGLSFDYRNAAVAPLHGRLEAAKASRHPIKALFTIFPSSIVPNHTIPLVIEVLEKSDVAVSQLACAADLLSAVMSAAIIRFAGNGEVVARWNVDFDHFALSPRERMKNAWKGLFLRPKMNRLIKAAR